MAFIQIQNLCFTYPEAITPVFEDITLHMDTSWRLGLIGRNGRGKTTFLKLLQGRLKGSGKINSEDKFEYFPLEVEDSRMLAITVAREAIAPFDRWEKEMRLLLQDSGEEALVRYGELEEAYRMADGYTINEQIASEVSRLGIHSRVLEQPYQTLSGGEQVKLLLAALFLKKHRFLLIDEPTDHLDTEGRHTVAKWLAGKSGFILVSHDRTFLDEAVDHILAINRCDIELQRGNYTSWKKNREQKDGYEMAENKKLKKSILRLKEAAKKNEDWSNKVEKSKHSVGVTYKHGPAMVDKGFIGAQAARMMQRAKAIEKRQDREIAEKQLLLKNIEQAEPLKFLTIVPEKRQLIYMENVSMNIAGNMILQELSTTINTGDRVAVAGANGTGKTTFMRILTGELQPTAGVVRRFGKLVISYMPQDTSFLHGNLQSYLMDIGGEEKLVLSLLRKLDFEREAFTQNMETYSAGQKKKVTLAISLAQPAHLFVWDEPLNYVDIISREQIEEAVLECQPTMVFIEHDEMFTNKIATKKIIS